MGSGHLRTVIDALAAPVLATETRSGASIQRAIPPSRRPSTPAGPSRPQPQSAGSSDDSNDAEPFDGRCATELAWTDGTWIGLDVAIVQYANWFGRPRIPTWLGMRPLAAVESEYR